MTGQQIAFEDVQVGDRVRVAWEHCGLDYTAELIVSNKDEDTLYPAKEGPGCVTAKGRTIILLDRPTPPALVDRMYEAYYPGGRRAVNSMDRVLAVAEPVIRAQVVAEIRAAIESMSCLNLGQFLKRSLVLALPELTEES